MSFRLSFFALTNIVVFSRLIGALKDILLANYFGRSFSLDLFLIALILPTLISNILGGAFGVALIPEFMRIRKKEVGLANEFLKNVFFLVLLSAILFSAVLVAFIPKFSILLTQGSATEVFSGNAGIYFRLLGLATIPNLMNAFLASLLTAEGRPKTPVILNCVSIFTVIILFLFSKKSIEDFCFATLIGIYLEGILLWMATKKMGFPNLFPFVPAPKLLTPFLKQSSFFLGGAALAYSSDFVDRSMAASLGSGSVSAIAYGSKITQLALSILVTGLSAYLLPYFSKLHSEGEFLRLKEEFLSFEKKIFLLSVLITSLIIWVSPLVLRLLFERGSFAHSDTLSVSEFQILFALQIPFYMTGMMSVWIINARQDNHLLAWIGASSFFVNILGNYFLMKFMGIKGIALATSLVYLLSFLLVRFFALRKFSPSK